MLHSASARHAMQTCKKEERKKKKKKEEKS
jgi:hypothetical protein